MSAERAHELGNLATAKASAPRVTEEPSSIHGEGKPNREYDDNQALARLGKKSVLRVSSALFI
jgi:hypothetical protein